VSNGPRDWDAATYDRIAEPQTRWGRAVLDRLPLTGDEHVLDAGCGTGRVTELLLARLPRGGVVALDGSPSMIEEARGRLGSGPRVEYVVADLARPLPLRAPVDAVFSTATFHWIADHERLFGRLRAALRPGGRLVAQCGGEGNITRLRGCAREVIEREPYRGRFADFKPPWNYAGAHETQARLLAAGFASAECWLAPAPKQPAQPREFLSTIVLGPHVQHLPEQLREPFMDEVLEHVGEPVVVDYVRLNIDAVA
jgi:trans-aconitate 2-methyltransferase